MVAGVRSDQRVLLTVVILLLRLVFFKKKNPRSVFVATRREMKIGRNDASSYPAEPLSRLLYVTSTNGSSVRVVRLAVCVYCGRVRTLVKATRCCSGSSIPREQEKKLFREPRFFLPREV